MMNFWELIEEIAYIYHMLGAYPTMLYVGILLLFPPFVLSLYKLFRSQLRGEEAWFLVTMINFIVNLIISTQTSSLLILILSFIVGQICAIRLIPHLANYEK